MSECTRSDGLRQTHEVFEGRCDASSSSSSFVAGYHAPSSSSFDGNSASTELLSQPPGASLGEHDMSASVFGTSLSRQPMFGTASGSKLSDNAKTAESIFGTSQSLPSCIPPPGAPLFGEAPGPHESIFNKPTEGTSIFSSGPRESIFNKPTEVTSIFSSGPCQSKFNKPTEGTSVFGAEISTSIFSSAPRESIFSKPKEEECAPGFGMQERSPAVSIPNEDASRVGATSDGGTSIFTTGTFQVPSNMEDSARELEVQAFGKKDTRTPSHALEPLVSTFVHPATSPESVFGAKRSRPQSGIAASSNSIFGRSAPSESIFGNTSPPTSIFGPPASSGSIFGSSAPSAASIFGNHAEPSSIFGNSVSSRSIFATQTQSAQPTFGSHSAPSAVDPPASSGSTSSIFGNNTAPSFTVGHPASSIFGNCAPCSTSIFGNSAAGSTSSVFGNVASSTRRQFDNATGSASIFDNPAESSKSIFGGLAAATDSVFSKPLTSGTIPDIPEVSPEATDKAVSSTENVVGNAVAPGASMFSSTVVPSNNVAPKESIFGSTVAPKESIFGSTVAPKESIFGSTVAPKESIFGSTGAPKESIFGSTVAPKESIFGSTVAPKESIFGSTVAPKKESIFGSTVASGNSIFSKTAASSQSDFGCQAATPGPEANSAAASSWSLPAVQEHSAAILGSSGTSSGSIFLGAAVTGSALNALPSASIFSSPNTSTGSIFDNPATSSLPVFSPPTIPPGSIFSSPSAPVSTFTNNPTALAPPDAQNENPQEASLSVFPGQRVASQFSMWLSGSADPHVFGSSSGALVPPEGAAARVSPRSDERVHDLGTSANSASSFAGSADDAAGVTLAGTHGIFGNVLAHDAPTRIKKESRNESHSSIFGVAAANIFGPANIIDKCADPVPSSHVFGTSFTSQTSPPISPHSGALCGASPPSSRRGKIFGASPPSIKPSSTSNIFGLPPECGIAPYVRSDPHDVNSPRSPEVLSTLPPPVLPSYDPPCFSFGASARGADCAPSACASTSPSDRGGLFGIIPTDSATADSVGACEARHELE